MCGRLLSPFVLVWTDLNQPTKDMQFSCREGSNLAFWWRNYFLNFSTSCIYNVNKTGTKYVRIMKQTAF